jgi:hypothetical protein
MSNDQTAEAFSALSFPGGIIAEYDDADSAVAHQKALGVAYVVTGGVEKCYAVRKLVRACPLFVDGRIPAFVLAEALKRAGLKIETQTDGRLLLTPRGNLGAFNGHYIADLNAQAINDLVAQKMRERGLR